MNIVIKDKNLLPINLRIKGLKNLKIETQIINLKISVSLSLIKKLKIIIIELK
jgi:hypothetical protein